MADSPKLVLDSPDIGTGRIAGAKAATLARLAAADIPVPEFFVVTSPAFAEHLLANGLQWPPTGSPESLRDQILQAPLPEPVAHAIDSALARLAGPEKGSKVAVRSSGAEEDSAQSSFAGQFASLLAVDPDGIFDAVKQCWASYLSESSIAYRRSRGLSLGAEPGLAVMVQSQVFSRAAGVLFTIHPMEPAGDTAYLEANFGTGESVAASLATPDAMTISRSTGKVVRKRVGSKRRMTTVSPGSSGTRVVEVDESMRRTAVLSDDEAESVYRAGRRIEELLGSPQDVEWALDSDQLWILQSRPITVLTPAND